MNTFQKTSLRATLIAATLAAMPFSTMAAGLGRISVLSALGQPLRAEIELTATADELSSMEAAVAAPTAFKDAGISFAPALRDIRMAVERRGKRSVLKLSSVRPINDPFMDVLVELNWSAGRLLREYTFLLDPPDMPAPAAAANVGSAVSKPVARAARPIGGGAGGDYRVKRGDTLGKIARENKPAGVSMDQMLIALYQANPDAFVDNNINRLRAGVILNVPDAATASAVPAGEARQQVIAHASDFNAYRRRVAERVADSAPVAPAETEQTSSGKITAKVEETPTPVTESKDQVKVSQSTEDAQSAPSAELGAANERLKSLEEDIVARDQALKEANDRLAALEKNITELQKLIEMKNESLASLQQQAKAGGETPTEAPSAEAPAAQTPAPVEPAPSAPPAAELGDKPAEASAMPAGAQDALEKELQDLVKPGAETPAETPPVAAAEPPVVTPAEPPVKETPPAPEVKKPVAAPVTPPPVQSEPSLVDDLMGNPLALGGIVAALAALGGLLVMRRKKASGGGGTANETAMASVFPPDQNSVFGETGGQSVDTGSSSLIQTDFSQSGLSAIDTDEGVDPVAEADVYMAYGRDAQAEEILLDAMKADPSRTAIHLKLLEIYSQRKNLQQFETTATELYTVTGGKGEAWDKAVEMGTKLDPDNPLFKRSPAPDVPAIDDGDDLGFTAPNAPSAAAAAAAGAALTGMASAASAPEAEEPAQEDFDASLNFTGALPTPDEPSPSQMKDTWAIPGELNQFTDSDAEDMLDRVGGGEASAEEDDVLAIDTGDLDFNLDLEETDVEGDVAAPILEPETADEGVEFDSSFDAADSSLEFNLDLSEPPPGNENMAETSVNGVAPELNLESTDVGGSAAVAGLADVTDEVEVDLEATDLGATSGIDFESVLSTGPDNDSGTDNVAVVDLEKTNFDGSLLDFDFDLDGDKAAKGETEMMATSLDLSDISLDLEGADQPASDLDMPSLPEAVGAPADALSDADMSFDLPGMDMPETAGEDAPPTLDMPVETAGDSAFAESTPQLDPNANEDLMMASLTKSVVTSLTDSRAVPELPAEEELNQEVDTKLELARAYEEMGDAEGARELLDEVMRDGDANQQGQAQSILARLG